MDMEELLDMALDIGIDEGRNLIVRPTTKDPRGKVRATSWTGTVMTALLIENLNTGKTEWMAPL